MFSTKPFSSILDLIRAFPDEQSCIDHLETIIWDNKPVSPFDKTSIVYKSTKNRYICKATNKYFNIKTNTIFEGTKIPLQQWFLAIYLFTSHKKGISSYQLAKDLAITQKSAWFMLQRIRYAMEHTSFKKEMEGIIEADETFVGGKNKNRHADKKVKNSQGRSFKDKTPVLGLLNREGNVKCVVIPDTKAQSIQPIILANVKKGSTIYSDEWWAYQGLNKFYNHGIVDHGRGQYVNELGETTNSIENFWSQFKRGLIGIYHNRATRKHLQGYANEFTFRFNFRQKATDERINLFLESTINKRLTYNSLIGK
jgi:transposase-like protein